LIRAAPYGYELPGAYPHRPGRPQSNPTVRGTRITVYDILEYMASGMSQEEILADFPDLLAEDIRAALLFAADRKRRLFSGPL
jgi:uncharacterized protein (DUF433 family)